VFSLGPAPFTGSFFPGVEDPWPDRIGLSFPFILSGSFAVLASVLRAGAPKAKRERAASRAGVAGFLLGAAAYLLALVVQVGSSL
jgi:hypothetical protein